MNQPSGTRSQDSRLFPCGDCLQTSTDSCHRRAVPPGLSQGHQGCHNATRTVTMPPAAMGPALEVAPKSRVTPRPRLSSQNPHGQTSTTQPWLSHNGLCSFHGN